jgi:hypothetical protein
MERALAASGAVFLTDDEREAVLEAIEGNIFTAHRAALRSARTKLERQP